jgi:8-oxo-dGTP pyrophosphatase MutT (NUDIX family)
MEDIPEVKKDILFRLIYSEGLRYRDLKPDDTDPKLFTYHLKKLIEEGLIEKTGIYYHLTYKGMFFTEKYRWTDKEFAPQPRVHVLVAIKTEDKFVMIKRARQSYLGYIDFPGGKAELNENTKQSAKRWLAEHTGYNSKIRLCAIVQVRNIYKGNILDNKLFTIYKGENAKKVSDVISDKGEVVLLTEDEIRKEKKVFPDVFPIIDNFTDKKIRYYDFIYYEPFEGKFEFKEII